MRKKEEKKPARKILVKKENKESQIKTPTKRESQKELKTSKKREKKELTIPVFNIKGEKISDYSFPKKFLETKVNLKLIAQYIRVYLANQRQGTISTKTRAEVTGSTRKIYRQKGTGRARHGDIKAPIFVGGGVAHGPKPRNFSLKINKKQKEKVFLMVLYQKVNENSLIVIDDLLSIKPKTKEFARIVKNLKLNDEKEVLLLYPNQGAKNLILASRNLPNVSLSSLANLNSYLLLKSSKAIFVKEAFEQLLKKYDN